MRRFKSFAVFQVFHSAGRRTLVFALSIATAILAGCANENHYVEPPPPEVTVARPTQRDVIEYLDAPANADSAEVIEVRARVRGFLKECLVNEGTKVEMNQLLLVIDEEPFQVQLEQANAQLVAAQTALQQAKQSKSREVIRAQLALDESQLNVAITEEERILPLVASRAISQEEVDRATAERKKNEAQVASTKANLAQIDADFETNIAAAQAQVAVARTAVREAEINLGYCRIKAPATGRIGRINQDVGNLVGDGQATLLTTVVMYDPIHIYATLSSDDFLKFRRAQPGGNDRYASDSKVPIELSLGSENDYRFHGHVDYHDPTVDKGTGTIELRGVFPNQDGAILPGMFGRIRIPVAKRTNALLVPDQALGIDQSGQFLLVVGNDDKVEYRPVQVGRSENGMRVVEGKIGPQDRVITEGLLRARTGMKVVPHQEAAKANVAATDAKHAVTRKTTAGQVPAAK